MLMNPINNINTPAGIQHSVTTELSNRINDFVANINQISSDLNTSLIGQSVINIQNDIAEFQAELELASKVAGEGVKALNTLANTQ